jgi:hypothetical protein
MRMLENPQPQELCPECAADGAPEQLDRRRFIRVVGGSAAALAVAGVAVPEAHAQNGIVRALARRARPAEALIHELYQSMTEDQRRMAVYPWNHGQTQSQLPIRLRFFNQAYGRPISQVYTNQQRELITRILRAISSDEAGYDRFATVLRTDNWNNSGLGGAAANIFGNPLEGQYAWTFTAHHLTLRCDGDSEPGAAFGGPLYYGHLPDGYSERNVFNFQTRRVRTVFDALSAPQRQRAVLNGTPGENYESVRFRASGQTVPGLPVTELTQDQRMLVKVVLRDILAPFRQEDVNEVMEIVQRNHAFERLHLAFYRDRGSNSDQRWHFWRLEGPGFVWNYRILPHVHCYVNIAARA